MRKAPALSALCDEQRAEAIAKSGTSLKADASIQNAAAASLNEARNRLEEIRDRAVNVLMEHTQRKDTLESFLRTFQELAEARREHMAVARCREIADAHLRALYPLALHQRDGSMSQMHTVASNIGILIEKVEAVRRKGTKSLFSDDPGTNHRILASIENRVVDAVIKARAAFVNVLDNEFRRFGWPMKVPAPETDSGIIESVNFYSQQLSKLQKVTGEGDFVPERTKWHRALSDSWAIAAILRAPLARFKYHFLETFRTEKGPDDLAHGATATSRFDRPEWAADFALERIREATPFLSKVAIEGPLSADVKFAEGFCRVFAEKVSYDCELALRTSTNDADADVLIAHASETAKQFDTKLRSGIINVEKQSSWETSGPVFMSSLHILSMNESFLSTWASSELRLAEKEVSKLLNRVLGSNFGETTENIASSNASATQVARDELEYICKEIISHIGEASQKCRVLDAPERVSTFLKWTELPLLQVVRSRLKEEVELFDYDSMSPDHVQRCARASFCARLLSEALDDRSLDPFYVNQEERLGRQFYREDISRLRSLHTSSCILLSDAISGSFIDAIRGGYSDRTRFGEISAPDAAIVLTHDLSEPLVAPLTSLEASLSAVAKGIPCRKSASTIWRPVAKALDAFFFDDVVLQCFVGGTRNAMAAASEQNEFLKPENAARMARQVAFDTETFVSTFSVVSNNPSQFLPVCGECFEILRIAANKVLLPSIPPRQEHEEVMEALRLVAESDEEGVLQAAKNALEGRLDICHISPRGALELLAIGGLQFAIRLM